jgi:hypothetical protein
MSMKHYTYVDNGKCEWFPPTGNELHGHLQPTKLFECDAKCLLDADKLFEHALNVGTITLTHKGKQPKSFDVSKLTTIGCSISSLTFSQILKNETKNLWKWVKGYLTASD